MRVTLLQKQSFDCFNIFKEVNHIHRLHKFISCKKCVVTHLMIETHQYLLAALKDIGINYTFIHSSNKH